MIIDYHAHFYPRRFMEEIAKHGQKYGVDLVSDEQGQEYLQFEGIHFWAYKEKFYEIRCPAVRGVPCNGFAGAASSSCVFRGRRL